MELPVSRIIEAAQVQRSTGNIHSIIDWWSGEGFQDFIERGFPYIGLFLVRVQFD